MNWGVKINGEDFSDIISVDGMEWSMIQTDSEDSGRSQVSKSMNRPDVSEGREIKFSGVDKIPYARAHALALAVRHRFVNLSYLDIADGEITRSVFIADLSFQSAFRIGGNVFFSGANFTATWTDLDPILD